MKKVKYLIFLGITALIVQGCYRDNEQDLYRFSSSICDTSSVTYSGTISQILSRNCVACHSGSSAYGNPQVFLDNYNGVKTVVDNGKLFNAVQYISKPMPPGGQLDYCSIADFRVWIKAGAPQN